MYLKINPFSTLSCCHHTFFSTCIMFQKNKNYICQVSTIRKWDWTFKTRQYFIYSINMSVVSLKVFFIKKSISFTRWKTIYIKWWRLHLSCQVFLIIKVQCLSLAPCRALSSDYSIELLCDKTLKRPRFQQLKWEKRNLFLRQTNPYPS